MIYLPKYRLFLLLFSCVLSLLLASCDPVRTAPLPRPATTVTRSSDQATIFVAPVRDDGSGELLALRASDGTVRWRRHLAINTPALLTTKTTVYVVGGLETLTGSRLYAFNARDGRLLWQTDLKSFGLLWMQISQNLLFLAGPVDGHIYALRTDDGSHLWQKTLPDRLKIFILHGDLLYTSGFGAGYVRALAASDGRLLWQYQPALPLVSDITISGSQLYLRTQDEYAAQGALLTLDAQHGTLLWQYHQSTSPLTGLALADNQLALTSANGQLTLLRAQDGTLLWQRNLAAHAHLSPPLLTAQHLLVVNNSTQTLSAFQLHDGASLWQKKISCPSLQLIMQNNERLFVLNPSTGLLCSLAVQDGTELWHTTLSSTDKSASFFPLSFVSTYLYTLSPDPGLLSVLRQQDGTLAWQYSLGGFEAGVPAPVAFIP